MTTKRKKFQPGPDADHLKLEGDWRDAMNKALKKERPKDGWPNPKKEGDADKST